MVQMVHTPVLRSQASTKTMLSRGLQQNLVKVTPSCILWPPEFVPLNLLEKAIIAIAF